VHDKLGVRNELLRVTVTVRGAGHRLVTFAVGELDAGFGNHPALLALNQDGVTLAQPRLVTDGDVKGGRYVSGVVDIYVGTGSAR
jgi:hypothetical protein